MSGRRLVAVDRGAAYLDEHLPGWEQSIDVERLDLSSPCNCVLGQLYPRPARLCWRTPYQAMRERLGLSENDARRLGFILWTTDAFWANLTRAWRRAIAERLERRAAA